MDVDKPCRLGWERMEGGLTEKMKYKHRMNIVKHGRKLTVLIPLAITLRIFDFGDKDAILNSF